MTWDTSSYNSKMQRIANALGVAYWSVSDCGCEDMLSLLDMLKEHGVHGAYVRYLATLLGFDADRLTLEQIATLMASNLDTQYHAAALALGLED